MECDQAGLLKDLNTQAQVAAGELMHSFPRGSRDVGAENTIQKYRTQLLVAPYETYARLSFVEMMHVAPLVRPLQLHSLTSAFPTQAGDRLFSLPFADLSDLIGQALKADDCTIKYVHGHHSDQALTTQSEQILNIAYHEAAFWFTGESVASFEEFQHWLTFRKGDFALWRRWFQSISIVGCLTAFPSALTPPTLHAPTLHAYSQVDTKDPLQPMQQPPPWDLDSTLKHRDVFRNITPTEDFLFGPQIDMFTDLGSLNPSPISGPSSSADETLFHSVKLNEHNGKVQENRSVRQPQTFDEFGKRQAKSKLLSRKSERAKTASSQMEIGGGKGLHLTTVDSLHSRPAKENSFSVLSNSTPGRSDCTHRSYSLTNMKTAPYQPLTGADTAPFTNPTDQGSFTPTPKPTNTRLLKKPAKRARTRKTEDATSSDNTKG